MQAPIVLSTGAIARYPLEREPGFLTRRLTFADLSQQVLAHQADEMGRWVIDTALLTDAEAADWLEFYRTVQGPVTAFTFVDPWDNCLKYSEAFENAAWTKNVNMTIGKNYLTRSEEFDHANWVKAGAPSVPVVTANNASAPDGTQSAEKIDFPATGAGQESTIDQNVFSAVPSVPSKQFTYSVWLRADSSITIKQQAFDDTNGFQQSCNLTTAWQRFSLTFTPHAGATLLRAQIINPENQGAKTIYAWGAQLEYGAAASDYTKTTTAATELLIADPFWQQAPSGMAGASFGLNSGMAKRARQYVLLNVSGGNLDQDMSIAPGGSGSARSLGLQFTKSVWIKKQGTATPPTVQIGLHDPVTLGETFTDLLSAPTSSWARQNVVSRFSPANPGTALRFRIEGVTTLGTFYVFGAQVEASGAASGYKKTTTKSGVRANCRFVEDRIKHSIPQFDHNSLGQLVIQEWNG